MSHPIFYSVDLFHWPQLHHSFTLLTRGRMELYFFDQLLGLAGHQRLVLQFLQLKGPVNLVSKRLAKWMRSCYYLDDVITLCLIISTPDAPSIWKASTILTGRGFKPPDWFRISYQFNYATSFLSLSSSPFLFLMKNPPLYHHSI